MLFMCWLLHCSTCSGFKHIRAHEYSCCVFGACALVSCAFLCAGTEASPLLVRCSQTEPHSLRVRINLCQREFQVHIPLQLRAHRPGSCFGNQSVGCSCWSWKTRRSLQRLVRPASVGAAGFRGDRTEEDQGKFPSHVFVVTL